MTATDTPSQVGRYRIIKSLGAGAMAQVYLAELETFGGFKRKVALKVVRREFVKDPKFIQLMSREAMIGSYLQHPNIVETLEFNEAEGLMFLALEYVEGETLEDIATRARNETGAGLPADLAIEVTIQVLKGLSYAHALTSPEGEPLGIVHRDLKPGNIMLSRHGVVKVMDFGIAKAKVASASITAVGQVRGTPIYMAPEQVTGRPMDGRSDQFAAATVFHEILTGQQVFLANNLIEIMRKVARADVGDAPARAERIHPGMGTVLARMWQQDPEKRYPDCGDAARLLEDMLLEVKRRGSLPRGAAQSPVDSAAREKPAARGAKSERPEKSEKAEKAAPSRGGGMFDLVAGLRLSSRKKKEAEEEEESIRRKKKKRRRPEGASGPAAPDAPPPDTRPSVPGVRAAAAGAGLRSRESGSDSERNDVSSMADTAELDGAALADATPDVGGDSVVFEDASLGNGSSASTEPLDDDEAGTVADEAAPGKSPADATRKVRPVEDAPPPRAAAPPTPASRASAVDGPTEALAGGRGRLPANPLLASVVGGSGAAPPARSAAIPPGAAGTGPIQWQDRPTAGLKEAGEGEGDADSAEASPEDGDEQPNEDGEWSSEQMDSFFFEPFEEK